MSTNNQNKRQQISKLQLSGNTYDIAVRKNWLENNQDDLAYIENRTHFVRSTNDAKALSSRMESDRMEGSYLQVTGGKTYHIYAPETDYAKISAGSSVVTSFVVYFPTLEELAADIASTTINEGEEEHTCQFNRSIILDQFQITKDLIVRLSFKFDSSFAASVQDYLEHKDLSADYKTVRVASGGTDYSVGLSVEAITKPENFSNDDVLNKVINTVYIGEAVIKLIDAAYLPVDHETIQIDGDGKISAAGALNAFKQEVDAKFELLDNLESVMNFRGVFSSPASIKEPKHGDIIVLSRSYLIGQDPGINITIRPHETEADATSTERAPDNTEQAPVVVAPDSTGDDEFSEEISLFDEPKNLIDLTNDNLTTEGDPTGTWLAAGTELIYVKHGDQAGCWHEIGIGDALIKELKSLTNLHKQELQNLDTALENKFNADETRLDNMFRALISIMREGLILDGGVVGNDTRTNNKLYYDEVGDDVNGDKPVYEASTEYEFEHSSEDESN